MQQTLNGFLVLTLCRLFIPVQQYLNNVCIKGSIVPFKDCIKTGTCPLLCDIKPKSDHQ